MMINFRKEFIIKLAGQNFKIYCLAGDYDDTSRSRIKELGATALDYKLNSKGLNPLGDALAVYDLIRLIKKYQPDIVFSFFVKPVIFGTIAAKLAGVPRIVGMLEGLGGAFTLHKNGSSAKTKFIKFIQILLYKLSLPLLDKLILLNSDDKKDLIDRYKIGVKSVEILGGIGVDLAKFKYSQAPAKPVSFIFVARLLAEKGVFEYLRAAKIIKQKHKEVKFYILGSFDETNPFGLKKRQLDMYLNDNIVIYPGFVDNVDEWIASSSVFVLPSYREGFPRSTQEAMAIGRAVITTDSVGCKETVTDGLNGFLVPPYEYEALVRKMEYFIQNPGTIDTMGLESRRIAEKKFDVHKANDRLLKMVLGDQIS